jgi:hypothetical protein
MAQMRVSSFHAADAELEALSNLADRVGIAKSRLIRVGIGRLAGVPLDDLRREAQALPDGRKPKREPANNGAGVSEGEVPVG